MLKKEKTMKKAYTFFLLTILMDSMRYVIEQTQRCVYTNARIRKQINSLQGDVNKPVRPETIMYCTQKELEEHTSFVFFFWKKTKETNPKQNHRSETYIHNVDQNITGK